jgi:hypothetical protein
MRRAKPSMFALGTAVAVLCGGWGFVTDGGGTKTAAPAPERTFANPILPGMYPDPSVCRVVIGLYATDHGKRATVPADFDWFEYASL